MHGNQPNKFQMGQRVNSHFAFKNEKPLFIKKKK